MYQKFLEQRKKISENLGKQEIWSLIDQWPLFCGTFNLARALAVSDLIKETITIPGHIAEFGTWKGSNLMLMAKTLTILDPMSNKKLIGFDGFEGLCSFNETKDGKASELQGKYKGDYDLLNTMIELFQFNDRVTLKKGNILETLPHLLETDP